MTERLDPQHPLLAARLEGTSLVEASAGTGKTWTITGLYVRLVLESGLEPRNILAVTYTNAATAELRGRIRETLAALGGHLSGEAPSTDILVLALAEIAARDPEGSKKRVASAVAAFDEAMVCTIHSFCQRALAEAAFESALPFETKLVPDDRALLREIAEDFWRVRAPGFGRGFAHYLASDGWTPEKLAERARPLLAPGVATILAPDTGALDDAAFVEAYDRCAELWATERDDIEEAMIASRAWMANSVTAAIKHVDSYLAGRWPSVRMELCQIDNGKRPVLARFAPSVIAAHGRAGYTLPTHPFFGCADTLLPLFEQAVVVYPQRLQRFLLEFAEEARVKLARRKLERGEQAYDDLLTRLAQALDGPGGPALAQMLRTRYRAALVDEFQDTDGVQYGIFKRVFVEGGLPLVLVGDPKQAIYAFRGADVFAYLAAASTAARLPLDVNRRSMPGLVRGVNALFAVEKSFAVDAIAFHEAVPLESPSDRLDVPGPARSPVTFWWAAPAAEGGKAKPLAKNDFGPRVIAATADEIARLLSCGATIVRKGEARALRGSDIAVLVISHREADAVRAALNARGVPSVTYGQSSVFDSEEAESFGRLLSAVADPLDAGLLRAALATPLIGLRAANIAALADDGPAWERWIELFQDYDAILAHSGPMRLWREIVRRHGIVARIGAREYGARALANYRHIAELLHREQSSARLDPAALALVLAKRRAADEPADPDVELLRLETDDHLVRVLTVHTSKGLEFPIVFCPFLWNGKLDEKSPLVRFHDRDDADRLKLDLGSAQMAAHRSQATVEALGESLRLAYVALTRAVHRLYVAHGQVNGAAESALAWLFHRPDPTASPLDALAAIRARLKGQPDALVADLRSRAATVPGLIAVEPLPAEERVRAATADAGAIACGAARRFDRERIEPRRIFSFSGLVASGAPEAPDYDAYVRPPLALATGDAVEDVFRIPAGASAGSALHEVFERLDFPAATHDVIEREAAIVLPQFGIAASWAPPVARMIADVLATPLDGAGLRLADVRAERRLVELQFAFPVSASGHGDLVELMREYRREAGLPLDSLAGLDLRVARGFMKGFVDLVFERDGRFHIVDYKSNLLGRTIDDYTAARVAAAVADEYYDLQYLIYAVALDRYLTWRLPGYSASSHFGGVHYLFLRGMRPGSGGHGVHFARPSEAIVARLRGILTAGGAS